MQLDYKATIILLTDLTDTERSAQTFDVLFASPHGNVCEIYFGVSDSEIPYGSFARGDWI